LYKAIQGQTLPALFLQSYSGGALGEWHSFDIKAIGSTITVSLDGIQFGQYTDSSAPLTNGGFTLGAYSGDTTNAVVDFDDISITALGQMLQMLPTLSGPLLNSASFSTGAVAPGSLVSVFGSNLASQQVSATSSPWPTWIGLGGVSLKANGVFPVPVFYVGPDQYNIQIPWELSGSSQATLSFVVDGVAGSTQAFVVTPYSPGIFTLNGQGTGQGAVTIATSGVIAAPTGSINGLGTEPVSRGDYLTIYCTGLGDVTNRPPDGAAASATELSYTLGAPTVMIGGVAAPVSFSGLAPGFTGLYQVNVQVPTNVPPGNAVPLTISNGGSVSNSVTFAVQ
jgi:uncharacterized protein (TIGR03437 family)